MPPVRDGPVPDLSGAVGSCSPTSGRGLEREEFQLCLQFFVDARTFRIVGGETLSRWKHPRLGLLGPDRYIPDLRGDGRISALDLFGLERTCAFLEDLDRQGIRDFFLSCNFSRRTFAAPDLPGGASRSSAATALPESC